MTFPHRSAYCFALMILASVVAWPASAQDDKDDAEIVNKKKYDALRAKAEDEYRLYFRKPQTVLEHWSAIRYEITVGKFDLAGYFLNELLKNHQGDDADKELLKIEKFEGLSKFLSLRKIERWSDHPPIQEEAKKNVETIIERVRSSLEKFLSDPERINKLVKQLDAPTIEERSFAFSELNRSRERAVPFMITALRNNLSKSLGSKIRDALFQMDRDVVPAFLEVLKAHDEKDAQEFDLRLVLLDLVHRRGDERAIRYLWHLGHASRYPPIVRDKARKVLADLLDIDLALVPLAKVKLTELAESYYQKKHRWIEGMPIRIWPWDGQSLAVKPIELTPPQAEEFFGTRYAREALDLDPTYRPAQIVLLHLLLEQRGSAPKLEEVLLQPLSPATQNLLVTIESDLLSDALERALDEGKTIVALPILEAIGQKGDVHAARLTSGSNPKGLLRALNYPDRRIQIAGVKAMLRMPAREKPIASGRIVEILGRFLANSDQPQALALNVPNLKAGAFRRGLLEAKLDPILVSDLRRVFEITQQSAGVEAIFVDPATPRRDLPFVLAQLSADANLGRTPIYVLAEKDQIETLKRQTNAFPSVRILKDSAGEFRIQDQLLAARAKELSNLEENLKERKASLEALVKDIQAFPLAPRKASDDPRKLLAKITEDENALVKGKSDLIGQTNLLKKLEVGWKQEFVQAIEKGVKENQGAPLSEAERKEFRKFAMETMLKMARGEIKGYDIRPAQGAILTALRSPDLVLPALEVMGTLPGADVQQALATLVLKPAAPEHQVPAAVVLNRHISKVGYVLPKNQLQDLRDLYAATKDNPDLKAQLALVMGGLRSRPEATGTLLRDFRPPPPPAPPAEKKEKKDDKDGN